ncbi:MAG: hypothetical protein K9J16_02800 [Melioribacteraceae bacterium]|nr:hypothetical protein [Melioribacteraceae bacterium]MCF8352937.1 hypothetical protein [Melioribacteraceae bacterium]MCF8395873.1 hypothetical protein [Melioribacteraceae bacterium]MCF8417454.1 hypothetical protein [Melioribacteraceae bacterium]
MSPALYNIIIAICSVVYVFAVVAVMDFLVRKGFPKDISRKVVHIAAGSWLVFWLLFDQTHWTKYLNVLPAFIWTVLLIVKGLTASPDDDAVKTMTRTGDRNELLRGPLYFTIVMNIMGTFYFNTALAATAMGFLGWGDGLAPVFGQKFGKHKYKIVTEKSIEGSLAFIVFGTLAAMLFNYIIIGYVDVSLILLCAAATTFAEAVSPRDLDNFLIPLACNFVFYFFA